MQQKLSVIARPVFCLEDSCRSRCPRSGYLYGNTTKRGAPFTSNARTGIRQPMDTRKQRNSSSLHLPNADNSELNSLHYRYAGDAHTRNPREPTAVGKRGNHEIQTGGKNPALLSCTPHVHEDLSFNVTLLGPSLIQPSPPLRSLPFLSVSSSETFTLTP